MIAEWLEWRTEIHHDWLKNEFLRRLRAFVLRLERNEEPEQISEFLQVYFPQWEDRYPGCRRVVDDAVDALSPRQLFDSPPLSGCGDDVKRWLPDLIHALFLVRTGIRRLTAEAEQALSKAQERYVSLSAGLDGKTPVGLEQLREQIEDWQQFERAVKAFSNLVAKLPHRIQVV